MRKSIIVTAVAALAFAGAAFAADIDNGNLLVKPVKNDRYSTGGYIMGKVELFGYVGDVKDTNKITGIVLRDIDHATPDQKHVIVEMAKAQHLAALEENHGKLVPIVDPMAPAATPAPAH